MLEPFEELARERVQLKNLRKKYERTFQPGVSIILPTCKPDFFNNIFNNYLRLNYTNKELLIILNNNQLDIKKYSLMAKNLENIRVYQLDENYSIGDCLNLGISEAKFDYFTKMDDDDYYCPNYLTDLMNVFKYNDVDITGKVSSFLYFEEDKELHFRDPQCQYRNAIYLLGSTILAKKNVFNKVKFLSISNDEDTFFLEDCHRLGLKIFAADRFNYVCIRHRNLQHHTWKITHKDLKVMTQKFITTNNYLPIITV